MGAPLDKFKDVFLPSVATPPVDKSEGRLTMAEPQPMSCTPDDDGRFVAEHERGVRDNREACFQLLKRLRREGSDPYAVVIPVPVLPRIPRRH